MRAVAAAVVVAVLAGVAAAQTPTAEDLAKVEIANANRVVVTGRLMAPVPDVGEGAPLYGKADMEAIRKEMSAEVAKTRAEYSNCTGQQMMPPVGSKPPTKITGGSLLVEKSEAVARVNQRVTRAIAATEAAENARRAAANGDVAQPVVEQAELVRQKAVNDLMEARRNLREADAALADFQDIRMTGRTPDRSELDGRAMQRRRLGWGTGIAQPERPANLIVKLDKAEQLEDPKLGPFLRVHGVMTNTGPKKEFMPAVTIAIFDNRGWLLEQRTGLLNATILPVAKVIVRSQSGERAPRYQIKPGEKQKFVFEFKPAPENVANVAVFFASKAEPPQGASMGIACRTSPKDLDDASRERSVDGRDSGFGEN